MLLMNCWIDVVFYSKINQGLALEIFLISYWTNPIRGFYEFFLWLSFRSFILITTFFSRLARYFFMTLCMKLKNHKYSRLWESNFFGKILARRTTARNGPIFPFVLYYSVFFCHWFISFLFYILHEVEGSWEYFVICTQNWWSRIFLKKFLFVQKRAKKAQNDPIFSCFPITEAFFYSLDLSDIHLFRCFLSLKHKIVCSGWFAPKFPPGSALDPLGGGELLAPLPPDPQLHFYVWSFLLNSIFFEKRQLLFF